MKKLCLLAIAMLGLAVIAAAAEEPFGMKSSTTATPRYNPDPEKKGYWHRRWDERRAQIAKGGVEIVFVGDSITHYWESDSVTNKRKIGGKTTFDKYFSKYNVMNLGYSGDRTEHTLWMTGDSKLLDNVNPKMVVVMIGTNNIGHKKAGVEATAAGIELIIKNIRSKAPDAKIVLFAIFPRSPKANHPYRKQIADINKIICKLADNKDVFFCDITDKLLEKDGSLSPTVMPDYLHPNDNGYEVWAQAIMPYVEKFVGKK